MGLLNVYHLYHVCKAPWGIEMKQINLNWVSNTYICVYLCFIFWALRIEPNWHMNKCDVWQLVGIQGFREKETSFWNVWPWRSSMRRIWCLKNMHVLDWQASGRRVLPGRQSVSQSSVVQLNARPTESRSDEGTWEITQCWLGGTRCKSRIGIWHNWQKGDISDTWGAVILPKGVRRVDLAAGGRKQVAPKGV